MKDPVALILFVAGLVALGYGLFLIESPVVTVVVGILLVLIALAQANDDGGRR